MRDLHPIIRTVKTEGLVRFSHPVHPGHRTVERAIISITGHIGSIAIKGIPGNQFSIQELIPIGFIKWVLNYHSDNLLPI